MAAQVIDLISLPSSPLSDVSASSRSSQKILFSTAPKRCPPPPHHRAAKELPYDLREQVVIKFEESLCPFILSHLGVVYSRSYRLFSLNFAAQSTYTWSGTGEQRTASLCTSPKPLGLDFDPRRPSLVEYACKGHGQNLRVQYCSAVS